MKSTKKVSEATRLKGHGEKFSRKALQAIAALITESTIAAAAKKVGIGERTLRRWMRIPGFKKMFEDEVHHRLQKATDGLEEAAPQAIGRLVTMLTEYDVKDNDRIDAAKTLIYAALKKQQIGQLERRLLLLEQKLIFEREQKTEDAVEEQAVLAADQRAPEASSVVPLRRTPAGRGELPEGEPPAESPSPSGTVTGQPLEGLRIRRRPKS